MERNGSKLKEVWRQEKIPVVFRKGKGTPLLVKLPASPNNQYWLKDSRRNLPEWSKQYHCWSAPKAWFEDTVKRTLDRWGKVYVIQPYRTQQKCAPACWNALGVICECSCMGENHGSGDPSGKWHIVSDAFAVQWGEMSYACRLIVPNDTQP